MWTQTVNAQKITDGGARRHIDQLVIEKESDLMVNGTLIGQFFHTPQLEKEWGIGYAVLCCGIDPQAVVAKYESGTIYITGPVIQNVTLDKRIEFTKPVASDVFQLTGYFQQAAMLYKKTAVTESVGIALNDQLLCCSEDLTQENALYKAIGQYVMANKSLPRDCMLLVSSKVDLGFMHKLIVAQVGIVILRTAPTKQALDLAKDYYISILGFARGRKYIAYK